MVNIGVLLPKLIIAKLKPGLPPLEHSVGLPTNNSTIADGKIWTFFPTTQVDKWFWRGANVVTQVTHP